MCVVIVSVFICREIIFTIVFVGFLFVERHINDGEKGGEPKGGGVAKKKEPSILSKINTFDVGGVAWGALAGWLVKALSLYGFPSHDDIVDVIQFTTAPHKHICELKTVLKETTKPLKSIKWPSTTSNQSTFHRPFCQSSQEWAMKLVFARNVKHFEIHFAQVFPGKVT